MPAFRQISVLIPIYEFNVVELVENLVQQCIFCEIDFEIICIDDCSSNAIQKENEALFSIEKVKYEVLDKNIGRSAIRNKLAEMAQYENLLFIDCDSKINNSYILNYVSYRKEFSVLYGGREEQVQIPETNKLLRWKYGKAREEKNAKSRSENPYHCFTLNNTFIKKSLFLKIKLEESLTQYGHEDTLFGYELKKRGKNIVHIDNPTIHLGLESNEDFLKKTLQGVQNLYFLYQKGYYDTKNKLLFVFSILTKLGIGKAIAKFFENTDKKIVADLQKGNISLLKFGVLKLIYLLKIHYGILS
jgi:glycosyltransferase involved in cell wall biosynthesis